ncbi:porin [Bartonella sp. MR63HLJHH]|uniref:porin n=1 Tax=Bartonella sp. MR63HLJHH TaxID=3243558 RepID=UPI0035CEE686
MNTKRLITASIFSLISASTALAADVMIPHQPAPSTSSTIVAPTFSWTGLYLGVQAGGFSSKSDMALVDQEKNLPLDKEFSPKLSGFVGGFYAGSNIDLGDNFIFGVDTDLMISGKKHTKTITIGAADNTTVENAVIRSRRSANPQTLPAPKALPSTGTQTQKTASGTSAVTNPGSRASASEASTGTLKSTATSPSTPSVQTQKASSKKTVPAKPAPTGSSSVGSAPAGSTVTRSATPEVGASKTQLKSPQVGTQSEATKTAQSTTTGSVSLKQPAATSESVPSSGTRSALGDQSSGVRASESKASEKPVAIKPASSTSSTGTDASQTTAKAATSVQSASQSSAAEKTVSSGGRLVLARSGSTSESEKDSNGTSGAQNGGHHGAHGSGNANPHGASHGGGHGSGAHAHGASSHASRSHGGQNMAGHGAQSTQAVDKNNSSAYGIEQMKKLASELGLDQEDEVETLNHTFKQNWGGATRVRIGFAADRFMPYLAGGIAYGQFQDTVSISVKDEDGRVVSSKNLADETKTMIGYTLGGGVDFSLLDNVIVRAEYRYSDFGKKKFAKEKLEVNYKTNDFRVGVAYKF